MTPSTVKKPSSNMLGFVIIPVIVVLTVVKLMVNLNRIGREDRERAQRQAQLDYLQNDPRTRHLFNPAAAPPGMSQAEYDRLTQSMDAARAHLDAVPASEPTPGGAPIGTEPAPATPP